jgi:putative Ca2+/H+ antiporter (TMEM165/GDT1 family)
MEIISSSFLLVFLSEMGDKTQLLAFSLATRFRRPWAIMAGILVATVLNHALASFSGSWIATHVPPNIMKIVLGVSFIAFGIWALFPDSAPESSREQNRFGPFLTTTVLFFLAEMGDKTQLATVALGARYASPVLVTLGTTLGMLGADGLAVFLSEKLVKRVQTRTLRWIAAGLFFAFGIISLIAAASP